MKLKYILLYYYQDTRISGYDSGNYTDFTADSSEPGRHVPKSRSVSDYQNIVSNPELRVSSMFTSHIKNYIILLCTNINYVLFFQGLGRHTWGSRRTMTDSGISVVSGQSQLPTNVNKREEYVYFVLFVNLHINVQ